MKSYLIQRGTFKDKVDISSITGIDSIISFDYMGSAEFEWGSLPASLKRIVKAHREDYLKVHEITINKKSFLVFITKEPHKILFSDTGIDSMESRIEYIQNLFNEKVVNPYGGLKEVLGIDSYFEGKTVKRLKRGCIQKMEVVSNYGYCDFWWDIENDFFVIPNKSEYSNKLNTAIARLIEKNFDKETK